jgi:hypothetical protein
MGAVEQHQAVDMQLHRANWLMPTRLQHGTRVSFQLQVLRFAGNPCRQTGTIEPIPLLCIIEI